MTRAVQQVVLRSLSHFRDYLEIFDNLEGYLRAFYQCIIKLLNKFWFRYFIGINPWFTRLLSSVKIRSL